MSTRGVVVWLTGKPSAGKSTFARLLASRISAQGRTPVILDGDQVRAQLYPPPGYDPVGREHFYTTLGNLAVLLAEQGLIVLVAATAHRRAYRDRARRMAPNFVEVFVDASREEVEARDAKGLYAGVRGGSVRDLPGADLEYEPPTSAEVHARGGRDEAALEAALRLSLPS
jgi:adenylylsulfate kinase